MADYQAALELRPNFPNALSNLALTHAQMVWSRCSFERCMHQSIGCAAAAAVCVYVHVCVFVCVCM